MCASRHPRSTTDQVPELTARQELLRMLYHPDHSSNFDDSLRLVREILPRQEPLSHADIDHLSDDEVSQLVERLRPILGGRRKMVLARLKQMLSDPL